MNAGDSSLTAKRDALLAWFGDLAPPAPAANGPLACAVAYSGGVDSAVVAHAAHMALGAQAIAVTGASASLASGELEAATELARRIGIRHLVLQTGEFATAEYVRNAPDRCYHCKTELYTQLERWAAGFAAEEADRERVAGASGSSLVFVNGANCDDLGDYRPGLQAAREHQVRSPLVECGFRKADVRALAAHWGLPVWDKPASPCLSSRVAYGEEVTPERLARIDQAERFLRDEGFAVARVRYHRGDHARVEVEPEAIVRLAAPAFRTRLTARLRELGFRFISVDLDGFRSGSLNSLVQLEVEAPPK